MEFTRTWRELVRHRRQLLLRAALRIPLVLSLTAMAVILGFVVRNDPSRALPTVFQAVIGLFWIFFVFVFGVRAFGKTHRIDRADLLLTTVFPRDVLGGLLVAEYLRAILNLSIPLIFVSLGFALGSGQPVVLLSIPGTTLLAVATALRSYT